LAGWYLLLIYFLAIRLPHPFGARNDVRKVSQ
jgi:hypothetical protein